MKRALLLFGALMALGPMNLVGQEQEFSIRSLAVLDLREYVSTAQG